MRVLLEQFAIGLDWSLYENKALAQRSAVESAAIAGKGRSRTCGRSIHDNRFVQGIGYFEADQVALTKQKLYGAALVIAEVYPSFIVYHELSDESVWFCAASNGEPLHSYDLITSRRQALQNFNDLHTTLQGVVVLGTHPVAVRTVEDLLEAQRHAKQLPKAALLQAPPGKYILPLMIVTLIMLVLGGGWIVYDRVVKAPSAGEEQARLAAMQLLIDQEAARLAEVERQKKLALVISAQREQGLDAPSPLAQWGVWRSFLSAIPPNVNGWSPAALDCLPARCTVSWRRGRAALPSSASTLPGEPGETTIDLVKTSFDLDAVALTHYPAKEAVDVAAFITDMASRQRNFTIAATAAEAEVSAIIPPELIRAEDAPVLIARDGGIDLVSDKMYMLSEALRRLVLPGVSLTSLQISDLKAGRVRSAVTLKARYRVMAEDAPVAATPSVAGVEGAAP